MAVKRFFPGQSIDGSLFSHEHFPDRGQTTSESRIKELVARVREYKQALMDERREKYSHASYLKKSTIFGSSVFLGLVAAISPLAYGASRGALACADGFKEPFGFGAALSFMAGLGTFSFLYSGYFRKREEIRVRKALFEYDNDIKNYELIHVLSPKYELEPLYSRKDVVELDKPIPTFSGKSTTLRDYAPSYIPEYYIHKLPDTFKVLSRDGKRLLSPRDAEWPTCKVRSTFWKFTFEGDFQLTIGERYMDDGRFCHNPEIRKMHPAGMYTTKINFGASGTGKSQSGVLPDCFQILAWNAGIDSEAQSADRVRAYAEELAAQGLDFNNPLNPYGKLSEDTFDAINSNGKNYAWEKIAMLLIEPKGDLYSDIQEILELAGRPNDLVALGTNAEQIELWRQRRQELRFTAHKLYALWDQGTAWEYLQNSLTTHLDGFWKSEIIRRFQTGDFQSLNPKDWQFQGVGSAFLLSDFNDDKKCPTVEYRQTRLESLNAVLGALVDATREVSDRLYPTSGFGIKESRSENQFLGFVFDKAGIKNSLASGGLPVFDHALTHGYRTALQELMGLLAAGVGDLTTYDDANPQLSVCDGLFSGLSIDGPSKGFFPCLRPISVLSATPPPPLAADQKPDILNMVASDLSGQPPIETDEIRLRQKIRFMAPVVRRPGEKYKEWVFRKGAAKAFAEHRHEVFREQYEKVKRAISAIPGPGDDLRNAYANLLDLLDHDSQMALGELAGDLGYERRKGAEGQSQWQRWLRGKGFSPVAERANGTFEKDVRVGLAPIDAAWHPGCWTELTTLIRKVCESLVEDYCRKGLAKSENESSTGTATRFRLSVNQAFEHLDDFVRAAHQYYAIMVPGSLGFAVRRIQDSQRLQEGIERSKKELEAKSPRQAKKLSNLERYYRSLGHLSSEMAGLISMAGLETVLVCSGGNAYNPIYNPDASAQAVANELGAALVNGEVKGEQFWSEAYTEMAAYFISICMAADGWVTITDVLTCFMSRAFYERKLMIAEQRLAVLKGMASRFTNGALAGEEDGLRNWTRGSMPVCLVAERDWALSQVREMSGMNVGPGEWLGRHMDDGTGLLVEGMVDPIVKPLPLEAFLALEAEPGGGFDAALRGSGRPGGSDQVFKSSRELADFLKGGKFRVPKERNQVLDVLAGLYVQEVQESMSGDMKRGVSKTLVDAFLVGKMVLAVLGDWQVVPIEKADPSSVLHTFKVQPPLTPPPVQGQEVQALETAIIQFKNFVATTLQGEALGDPKTKGNVLISFQVKVGLLRSDAAMYSFSPGSKYDITFPTFQEMRDKGLVVVSRITDSVYLGIDQLISRMAIQQFQRTIRSRVGRYKSLFWAPRGELTQLQKANLETSGLVQKLVGRRLASLESPVERKDDGREASDPKSKLKSFILEVEGLGAEKFPSPMELEKFRLYGNLFPMNVEGAGLVNGGTLSRGAAEALGMDLLAMAGALQVARSRGDLSGEAIDITSNRWKFLSRKWTFEDDLVLRGLALLTVYGGDLQRALELGAKGRYGAPVKAWLESVYHDNLGGIRSDLRFAEQKKQAELHQRHREESVEVVRDRRWLLEYATTLMDVPDLRRLVAYVCDEVQQYVIPAAGKTQGDGSFYEVARAGMVFCILATQTPSSLKSTLGEGFNRYIGNILTWVILKVPVKEDAELVASMLGTEETSQNLQVDGTLQSTSDTAGGVRGTNEDISVKWDSKGERKQKVHYTELMTQESMQAYAMVTDGQRRYVYKLFTTPYFVVAGQKVNPYGPKGLMLRAEERHAENPGLVLKYDEAMAIVQDHGNPLVEEPVVKLIQHRIMDMSKSRTAQEIENDARLHGMRVAQRLDDDE